MKPRPRDTSKSYSEDFLAFADRVKIGDYYRGLAAFRLYVRWGITDIEIPVTGYDGLRDPNDFDVIEGYTQNEQDLLIRGWLHEVKSRTVAFKDPKSFPFETAIVDTCDSFEMKTIKPKVYIFISQRTHRLLAIDVRKTYLSWRRERMYDRDRGHEDWFYTCPRELLKSEHELAFGLRRAPVWSPSLNRQRGWVSVEEMLGFAVG